MKCFFIIIILFFSYSFIYSQGFEFSEYVDLDTDTLVTAAVEQAIAYNSPYTEVVIVAKDSGTSPTLPTWFFPAMNDLPSFFSDGTFGQFEYDNVVLTVVKIRHSYSRKFTGILFREVAGMFIKEKI